MSTEVDALAAADPALPCLPVFLDDGRLAAWFGAASGRAVRVSRHYLRYKPGTSCVLSAEVDSGTGPEPVLLAGYAPRTAAKLHKSQRMAPPHAVYAVDRALRILAVAPEADRDLPALRPLATPGARSSLLRQLLGSDLPDVQPRTLSYNPRRRWVGRLDGIDGSVVLRAYRPGDLADALAGYPGPDERLGHEVGHEVGHEPLSRQLGRHVPTGLAAVSYLSGHPLQPGRTPADASADLLTAMGEVLAEQHARRPPLPDAGPSAEVAAVRASVRLASGLVPALAPRLGELAGLVVERLIRQGFVGPVGTLHGDLSLDQVIVSPTGRVGLIDFDRARHGPIALDLGSLAATLRMNAVPGADDVVLRVAAGLPEPPPADAVRAHTGAQLLRRIAEPFRRCRPDWAEETARLVDVVAELT